MKRFKFIKFKSMCEHFKWDACLGGKCIFEGVQYDILKLEKDNEKYNVKYTDEYLNCWYYIELDGSIVWIKPYYESFAPQYLPCVTPEDLA